MDVLATNDPRSLVTSYETFVDRSFSSRASRWSPVHCVTCTISLIYNQAAQPVAVAHLPTPADRARAWWRKARRVYPEATLRAWRFDWAAFIAFCKSRRLLPLPASPATVAAFIEACGEPAKNPPPCAGISGTLQCLDMLDAEGGFGVLAHIELTGAFGDDYFASHCA
jgi:hypothetical protein